MTARNSLAIIAAGAKAGAVMAKARALQLAGCPTVPSITVFEKSDVGALWGETDGYSDGNPLICTAPERDIGFPYHRFATTDDKDDIESDSPITGENAAEAAVKALERSGTKGLPNSEVFQVV